MKKLFRTSVLLTVLQSASLCTAQDAAESPEAAPAEAVATSAIQDGQVVFSMPTLEKTWEAQAVLNTTRDHIAHIVNDEDVVVVQSTAGLVTVLNAENGRRYWSAQIGRNDEVSVPATTDENLVVVASGPVIHGMEKFTGRRLFSYALTHVPTASPILVNREQSFQGNIRISRHLYIPVSDGSVLSFDVDNLKRIGQLGTLPDDVPRAIEWRFVAGEGIPFAPVAGEDRIAFATGPGNLHCVGMFGANAGKSRFQFFLKQGTSAPPIVVTRMGRQYLLAASSDNRLFCVVMRQYEQGGKDQYKVTPAGSTLWTVPLSRDITQPILSVDKDVFFVTNDHVLAKHELETGHLAVVPAGVSAIVSQVESERGKLRTYGASVELQADGLFSFSPIRVANRSTGQVIRSLTIDLTPTALSFVADADDATLPRIRFLGNSVEATGLRTQNLSADRKILTMEFSGFQPEELLYMMPELEHTDLPPARLSAELLADAEIKAYVAPERVRTASVSEDDGETEAFPPRALSGHFEPVLNPWHIRDVKQLVAVSANAVYYLDRNDQLNSVDRVYGQPMSSLSANDYQIRQFNERTDRVIMSTSSGRVASYAETRIELGSLMFPAGHSALWVLYPKVKLEADFARHHQNPQNQPIMPEVSKPEQPAADSAVQQ